MTLRTRMRVEALMAFIAGVLTVVTLIWPDWIELVFNESPDGGDGSAERAIAIVWLLAAVVFGWLARRDWSKLVLAAVNR